MPYTDDKIYGPYEIDKVVITGEDLKKRRLLAISSEVYYYNTTLWREALRYMQKVGDRKAEQQIFMKRVSYANSQAAKGIFIGMGLTVGAVAAVGVGAVASAYPLAQAIAVKTWGVAKPVWAFNKATKVAKAGVNIVTQGLTEEEGWKGIDVVSPISEGLGFGFSLLTNTIELRPFSDNKDRYFRSVGHNKPISELVVDIGVQSILGGSRNAISKGVKGQFRNRELPTKVIDQLFSPMIHAPHLFIIRNISDDIKQKITTDDICNE